MRVALRSPRLGLRARIMAAFALGALLLSVFLSVLTYGLARENLLRQRESSAVRQAFVNASRVRNALRTTDPDVPQVLSSLETPQGSRPLLNLRGDWFSLSLGVGRESLPPELVEQVRSGSAARMRFSLDSDTELATGVPIPTADALYFEVVSLRSLAQTLDFLALALGAAAVVTTVAGAALGGWASRRVLRPLATVGDAAEAIATGRLDTRLDRVRDPDLERLVESFNRMAGALQQRIERDARFASDVSHELRSPLTTLSATIEVLEGRREEMPARAVAALDLLVGDVRRFQAMVEDLLEISRVDAGVPNLQTEEVLAGELVLRAVEMSGVEAPVDLHADAASTVIEADKRRMVRVLVNLLHNAESHGGGVTAVRVRPADDRVQFVVEDEGPGVSEEDRERIFERFSRGGGGGRRGGGADGVGLGLALVADHVRLHGGRVWVEGPADGTTGAHFVVELPAVMVDDTAPEGGTDGGTHDVAVEEVAR